MTTRFTTTISIPAPVLIFLFTKTISTQCLKTAKKSHFEFWRLFLFLLICQSSLKLTKFNVNNFPIWWDIFVTFSPTVTKKEKHLTWSTTERQKTERISDCRGKTFDNGKSTISTVGTICGGKAVGISVDVNVFQPHIVAANLAHSIGW